MRSTGAAPDRRRGATPAASGRTEWELPESEGAGSARPSEKLTVPGGSDDSGDISRERAG